MNRGILFNNFKLKSEKNIKNEITDTQLLQITNKFINTLMENKFILNLNFTQYKNKKGKFVDIRKGLIYLSPVGLLSTDEYRKQFLEYEIKNNWRNYMISELKKINIPNLSIVIGGSIGIAVYPCDWNKSQILEYVKQESDSKIYFFGDKTDIDGNDYPLYSHEDVIGFSVNSPDDTMKHINITF